jgi:hypothetical protein
VNYTWKILRLGLKDQLNQDGQLLENAVVNVKWRRIGEDTDGSRASYVGNTSFSAASVSAADFTNLNDLTNTQVIAWLETALEGDLVRIDSQITRRIEKNRVQNIKPNW